MITKAQIIYVVTHEAKLDGKWLKASRAFSNHSDAVMEIKSLLNLSNLPKAWVRKVVPEPQSMIAYL